MLALCSLLQASSSHLWGLRISKNSSGIYGDRCFFFWFYKKESFNYGTVNAPKLSKQNNSLISGGGSRTPAASNMKPLVAIVDGFSSLNIITNSTISDVAGVLDMLPHSLNIHSFISTAHLYKNTSTIAFTSLIEKAIVMALK